MQHARVRHVRQGERRGPGHRPSRHSSETEIGKTKIHFRNFGRSQLVPSSTSRTIGNFCLFLESFQSSFFLKMGGGISSNILLGGSLQEKFRVA